MKYALLLVISMSVAVSCTGIVPFFHRGSSYSSDVTRRLTPVEDPATGLYGYVNDLGFWAIQPRFRSAQYFQSNGLARVRLGNRFGAINMAGNTVINFNFTKSYDVDAAIVSMAKGRLRGIDLWMECDPNSELCGYLDYYGNWYIRPQYYNAREFNQDGFAVVEVKRGQWGAIDRNNRIVIQPNFSSSYEVENALHRLMRY